MMRFICLFVSNIVSSNCKTERWKRDDSFSPPTIRRLCGEKPPGVHFSHSLLLYVGGEFAFIETASSISNQLLLYIVPSSIT